MNSRKVKLIVNVVVFTLLAIFAVLALTTFFILGEGERVNLSNDKPKTNASPK